MTRDEAVAALVAPGQPFEITTETVNGWAGIPVYARRPPSLRAMAELGAGHGARPFLTAGDRQWTFAGFLAEANGVSRGLLRLGVRPGERVGVLAANCPEWALAFWGAVDVGGVVVGLNGWWKAAEILDAVRRTEPRVLVADRRRWDRIAGHWRAGDLPSVEHVVLVAGDGDAEEGSGSGGEPGVRPFTELVVDPGPEMPAVEVGEDDPAVIFFTSGTTGAAKGVVATHRGMVANLQNVFLVGAAGAAAGGPAPPQSRTERRTLLTSPMFHVSGCHSGIVLGFVTGQHQVLPPPGRLTAEGVMDLIDRHRITFWPSVPTLVWRVCTHPQRRRWDLSSVTRLAFGGAAAPPELHRLARQTFPSLGDDLGTGWGLTETTSAVTSNAGAEYLAHPGSVGRPFPIVQVEVVDGDGRRVPTGTDGRIRVRGCQVTPGYWRDPEATAAAITPDGWFDTGDIGHLDAEGRLHLTDRAKDVIVRGGENISSVEVEHRLAAHPAVDEVAVVGVPHPELGEQVKAVYCTRPGATVAVDELAEFAAATLAAFKVPALWEHRTEPLPRNAAGKVQKAGLRPPGPAARGEGGR